MKAQRLLIWQGGNSRAGKVVSALRALQLEAGSIEVAAGSGGVDVEIFAVLDPLSKPAQRVAPVLDFLRRTLQPAITVVMASN
jgi:hypothetical protein